MNVTDKRYFDPFFALIGKDIQTLFALTNLQDNQLDLGYQTQASAVYSSNIEGNSLNLNSFMNLKHSKNGLKASKEVQEIDDLITAYQFAQNEKLTEKNLLQTHKLLAKKLVIASLRGKYRNDKVGVFEATGLVYLAIEEEFVPATMKTFFGEIAFLLSKTLTLEQVFYHAALIHLKFVHIHPFRDGNGRAARLLEKWFLAEKLGKDLWKLQTERYYKSQQAEYYKNINLGINYYELNYDKCLPFLAMLPSSLTQE
ncbi:MAG: Fic family protein [Flectobacillus sp.]|nr:Fic family protein [Flectobacillus sp.]